MPDRFAAVRALLATGPWPIDGGLASELEARGHDLPGPLWSARLLRESPAAIRDVHFAYARAGANVLISASYQASRTGFAALGLSAEQADAALGLSVLLAQQARDLASDLPRKIPPAFPVSPPARSGAVDGGIDLPREADGDLGTRGSGQRNLPRKTPPMASPSVGARGVHDVGGAAAYGGVDLPREAEGGVGHRGSGPRNLPRKISSAFPVTGVARAGAQGVGGSPPRGREAGLGAVGGEVRDLPRKNRPADSKDPEVPPPDLMNSTFGSGAGGVPPVRETYGGDDIGDQPQPPPQVLVAASVGPYGAVLHNGSEYRGRYGLSHAQLLAFHRERLDVLAAVGPDLFAVETIPDADEVTAIVTALADHPDIPAWISLSCRDGVRTNAGQPIEEAAAAAAAGASVVAVGVNCTPPQFVTEALNRMQVGLPLIAYPNSGRDWDAGTGCWVGGGVADLPTGDVSSWVEAGARLVGGCCGIGPAAIARLDRDLTPLRNTSIRAD